MSKETKAKEPSTDSKKLEWQPEKSVMRILEETYSNKKDKKAEADKR